MLAPSAALVRYRLVEAKDPRGGYEVSGAVWAAPDVAHAAEWLRRLAEDAPLRHSLGRAGRLMAMNRLGTDGLANAVRALGI
jgi:hypothetical protein